VSERVIARPLRVVEFIATSARDPDRGPLVRLNPEDATVRLLGDHQLAWVYGPRRHELAEVRVDPTVPKGDVVVRDVAGVSASEVVRVIKPDLDSHGRTGAFA